MRTSSSWILSLCVLGACASPKLAPDYYTSSDRGLGLAPSATANPEASPAMSAAPQGQDYSVAAMFHQRHGEFMQSMRPFRPSLNFEYESRNNNDIKGETGHYDLTRFRADGVLELEVDPDTQILLGGRYEQRDYRLQNGMQGGSKDKVFEIGANIGARHFFTDDLEITAMFRPGVYSDVDGPLHHEDWNWYGDVIGTFRASDSVYAKLGVEASGVFEDVPVYPVAGVAWLISESWRIDVLLPRMVEFSWMPTASMIFSGGVDLWGEQYQVRSPVNTGKQDFEWTLQEFKLYARGQYRMSDNFSLMGRVGTTLAGDHKFRGTNGIANGTLEPAFFFELGAGINF